MSVKIPTKQSEVSKEWLKEALSCDSNQVEVLELENIKEKNGFMSNVFKAKAKINDQCRKLFIKIITEADDPMRGMFTAFNFDENEVQSYKSLLPALIEFEKETTGKSELENMTPKFFAGGFNLEADERGFFLIMEDLSESHTMQKEGLDFEQAKNVLVQMARFHAVAFSFVAKHSEEAKEWRLNSWYQQFIQADEFKGMIEANISAFAEDVIKEEPAFADSIKNLQQRWLEVYMNNVIIKDERFIAHGDLWLNNVMFDKNNVVKILDWQMVATDHPLMDVAFLLCSSIEPKTLDSFCDDLLKAYVEKVEETCKLFSLEAPFDLDGFKNLFYKRGIVMAFLILVSGYAEVVRPKPEFKKRVFWQLKKSVETTPELFE